MEEIIMRFFLAVLLLVSNSVNASLIDHGRYLTDPSTRMNWLKLTETQNLSYNSVLSLLDSGERLDGWRYATIFEVDAMVRKQGIVGEPSHCAGCSLDLKASNPKNNGKVFNLIQLFGALSISVSGNNGETEYYSKGWTGTDVSESYPTLTGRSVVTLIDFEAGTPRSIDAVVSVDIGSYMDNLDETQIALGSFLVRPSVSVSEPSSIMLFALVILALFSQRLNVLFSKKHTSNRPSNG